MKANQFLDLANKKKKYSNFQVALLLQTKELDGLVNTIDEET